MSAPRKAAWTLRRVVLACALIVAAACWIGAALVAGML